MVFSVFEGEVFLLRGAWVFTEGWLWCGGWVGLLRGRRVSSIVVKNFFQCKIFFSVKIFSKIFSKIKIKNVFDL
eukprot:TRINITY_DN0_c59_g1_i1.p1 TRINITY_DN0_c59_g1~~TRINITY_DN0_c59_g1_i1.p1  ORF type:complete len:74 (+),score=6.77 TRINITY_DN0_c59_g1_i1:496-717(+)